jgi:hypothetical protein
MLSEKRLSLQYQTLREERRKEMSLKKKIAELPKDKP